MSRVTQYSNPKIMVIDLRDNTFDELKDAGWSVTKGSFGNDQNVAKDNDFVVAKDYSDLKGIMEKDIVILDLARPDFKHRSLVSTVVGEKAIWTKIRDGIIDHRMVSMYLNQPVFDRVLNHGGIFICFTSPKLVREYFYGHRDYGGTMDLEYSLELNNWAFLSVLDEVSTPHSVGVEIHPNSNLLLSKPAMSEYIVDASFSCSLDWSSGDKDRWIPLATNKFGDVVGAAIAPEDQSLGDSRSKGWVFLLPRVRRRPALIRHMLGEVLPELAPNLFPEHEGSKWIYRPEYDAPGVLDLKDKVQEIQQHAQLETARLVEQIEDVRSKQSYLSTLLTGTGKILVDAVKETLQSIGFSNVIDVDANRTGTDSSRQLDEDLQIDDRTPLLLVEVKGVSGGAKDGDALAVGKYIASRMRELSRNDINGLAIINHQRNTPPLDRENANAFRELIVKEAERQELGLMTTWDLFRLARSFFANGWRFEDVRDVFYRHGRIEPVPTHYLYVGRVSRYAPNKEVVGILLEQGTIELGARIAFETPVVFVEQDIESLQIDLNDVTVAVKGDEVGIKSSISKDQVRVGSRVFVLSRDDIGHGS